MSKFRIFWRGEYSEHRGSFFGWYLSDEAPLEFTSSKEADDKVRELSVEWPNAMYMKVEVDDDD